jgi:uncharacterized membrane protein YcjF (UPF0283 family)
MGTVETVFAVVVTVLAAVAVIGALVFAISWEWFAFRRLLERHRKPDPYEDFWRRQRALTEPK